VKNKANYKEIKDLKEKIITVRLTELQYELIYQLAFTHKRTISDFVRLKSLGEL